MQTITIGIRRYQRGTQKDNQEGFIGCLYSFVFCSPHTIEFYLMTLQTFIKSYKDVTLGKLNILTIIKQKEVINMIRFRIACTTKTHPNIL